MADALSTLAYMFQLTSHRDLPYIKFRCRGKPAHYCLIEEEQDDKPWYFDIKRYVECKEYPPEVSNNDENVKEIGGRFLLKRKYTIQEKP